MIPDRFNRLVTGNTHNVLCTIAYQGNIADTIYISTVLTGRSSTLKAAGPDEAFCETSYVAKLLRKENMEQLCAIPPEATTSGQNWLSDLTRPSDKTD